MDSDDPPSNFVSTSPSRQTAIQFGTRFETRKNYLYTLRKIDGINVNKELKNLVPFADETEIAIPKKIDRGDIFGVTPLKKMAATWDTLSQIQIGCEMEQIEISIVVDGNKEVASLCCDDTRANTIFSMNNGFSKKYESQDLYLCLAKIREDLLHIKFLCKGSKLNVTPSRMCSQMSGGGVAYELKFGKSATFDDIVHIFDYEEDNIAKSLEDQIAF